MNSTNYTEVKITLLNNGKKISEEVVACKNSKNCNGAKACVFVQYPLTLGAETSGLFSKPYDGPRLQRDVPIKMNGGTDESLMKYLGVLKKVCARRQSVNQNTKQ